MEKKPIDYACPRCGAAPGKSCVTSECGKNGRPLSTLAHPERMALAENS